MSHKDAEQRILDRLRRWPGWPQSWEGLWWSHKATMHRAAAAGQRPRPTLACWSLGVWALEGLRDSLYPWQYARRRRALAVRLGLPEDM